MFLEALIIGVLLGILFGGKLANLGNLEINRYYIPLVAFLAQAGLSWNKDVGLAMSEIVVPIIHLASYLLMFWWLWENRIIKGIWLLVLGVSLNFMVIAGNGGYMPVDGSQVSAQILQVLDNKEDGIHSLLTEKSRFRYLADIIYLPYPQPSLISLGDIFLSLGLFWISFYYTKDKSTRFRLFSCN